MHNLVFRIGFSVVALCTLIHFLSWLLLLGGARIPIGIWYTLIEPFSHPIPQLIRGYLPYFVNLVLFVGFLALILRRLFLMARSRSFVAPSAYTRAPYVLLAISVASLVLGIAALVLSMLFRVGSGVPAGLIMVPATLLLPVGITWAELISFRVSPNA